MKRVIRTFFRTLRLILGPFMLLWERLTRPPGVVRTPDAQTTVNLQCRNLALYQYRTCPFCIRVRQEMRRLSLPIVWLDAQHDTIHRSALLQGAGSARVPCLKITDAAGQSQWLQESDAIIAYLRGRFGPV